MRYYGIVVINKAVFLLILYTNYPHTAVEKISAKAKKMALIKIENPINLRANTIAYYTNILKNFKIDAQMV